LKEQFDLSIKYLYNILNMPADKVAPDFRIHCLYWIGYENNNLAKFDEAERNFSQAIALANQNSFRKRGLLLKRLLIETKLFRTNKASLLIDDMENLVAEYKALDIPDDEDIDLIYLVQGNVLYASAVEAFVEGDAETAKQRMHSATKVWQPLIERRPDAAREYAFARLALNENDEEGLNLLKNRVRQWAEEQVRDRIGARFKAYHSMTLLMIAKAGKDEDCVTSLDVALRDFTGRVHPRVMIYSPLRKRNVSRDEFSKDVNMVQEKGLPLIVA